MLKLHTAALQHSDTGQQLHILDTLRAILCRKQKPEAKSVSNRQPLQAKVLSGAPVQLIERITHATRARPPKLSIQCLYLLKLRVNHGGLVRERHESRILRLQSGGDRCGTGRDRERYFTDGDKAAHIEECIGSVRRLKRVFVRFAWGGIF